MILGLWIFIVISIFVFYQFTKNETRLHILQSVQQDSQQASSYINKAIYMRLSLLRVAAKHLTDEDLANPEQAVHLFDNVLEKNNLKTAGIAFPDGTAYLSTGDIVNIADRDYFKSAMRGESTISQTIESKLNASYVNIYSTPITRDEHIVAVLWLSISTQDFIKNIRLNSEESLGDSFIVDSKGNLISAVDVDNNNYNIFSLLQENCINSTSTVQALHQDFINSQNSYQTFRSMQGDVYLYYSKLNYNDWWVITRVYNADLVNFSTSLFNTMTLIAIVLVVLSSGGFFLLYFKAKKTSKHLENLAYIDNITGGHSDLFLKDNLKHFLNTKQQYALIALDISNIKSIVGILGLLNTQIIVKEFYRQLASLLKPGEYVTHSCLGEYKLLLTYTSISELTQRLEAEIQREQNKGIEFTAGIYPITETFISFEDICSFVNIAKEHPKTDTIYTIYSKELHQQSIEKMHLEEKIDKGIANKEFKAWFQPKYNADGTTIVGAEALVRWYSNKSIISPYAFIPTCETNGTIKDIDRLILEDVCQHLQRWIAAQKKVVPISVNLSRTYLDNSDYMNELVSIVETYQIPTNLIEFEVTESAMAGNETELKETIEQLHAKGFKILLDDFGVGYSSIKAISDMKFDTLKIDKSFIDGIGEKRWEDIIQYTIQLSKTFQMEVVAEGIETEEQYRFLSGCSCNVFQGYYFGKPMDSEHFTNLL